MTKYRTQEVDKRNKNLIHTIEFMFKNVKSGNIIYIAFSKKTFYALIFTLGTSIIANIILAYLIVNLLINSVLIKSVDIFIYIVVLVLLIVATFSGLWLVFKGIDIVTDNVDFG